MEIDRIYLIEGERYRLAQISTSLGSLPEYTFVPASNIELRTNARADVVDTTASVPAQYPITADGLTFNADELTVGSTVVNLGTPYTVDSAAVSAPPTDADGDDATFVWDPPRVNEILDTRYPDAMDGPIVGRRSQIMMADDPPELDLDEITSVSRPDDGNVVLEGFRSLHPQIPTGDTYRIVQPNINIASPATTNIFSDNIVADSADRWIDDQRAKYIEEVKKELNNILNKPAAEPIDNDAWDELFTPAT